MPAPTMIGHDSHARSAERTAAVGVSVLATLLVILLYAVIGHFDSWQLGRKPEDAYYNLLVKSFQARHTDLPLAAPEGLLRLTNPYDPDANADYRAEIHDLSLYRGKLYLYFGPTPALLGFWPFHAVTGRYLAHRDAVVLFCTLALLINVALWREMCRRLVGGASAITGVAGVLMLGLVGVPILLGRGDVWEVPIACGMFLVAVFLFSTWRALQDDAKPTRWLLLASVAYGLALGARPSLLVGAIALLIPVSDAWRRVGSGAARAKLILAAFGPACACGLALLAYNAVRFDNPFEFGQRYQLAADATATAHLFSFAHAWHNLGTYLFGAVDWTPWFPFVVHAKIANPVDGRLALDGTFGVLTHLPVVWTALGAVLVGRAFRNHALSAFTRATLLLWLGIVAVVASFAGACDRYEVEFLVPLSWLALIGALSLDTILQWWPAARSTGRIAWGLLLGTSIGFSGLASFRQSVEAESIDGGIALNAGAYEIAAKHYDAALAIDPYDAAANYGYGMALANRGRLSAATPYLGRAVRHDPHRAGYRSSYGEALAVLGRPTEGEAELRRALALNPQLAPAHQGLGRVLLRTGRAREALGELEIAQGLQPTLRGLDRDLQQAKRAAEQ